MFSFSTGQTWVGKGTKAYFEMIGKNVSGRKQIVVKQNAVHTVENDLRFEKAWLVLEANCLFEKRKYAIKSYFLFNKWPKGCSSYLVGTFRPCPCAAIADPFPS